jgi:uncharacterized protein
MNKNTIIQRDFVGVLLKRLAEPRRFIQAVLGPRQVGKTTGVLQALKLLKSPSFYVSADEEAAPGFAWVVSQWQRARQLGPDTVLVLDEVQKAAQWSDAVKKCWDEDSRNGNGPRVVLLGSAALKVGHGLKESLAGRFEILPVEHWGWAESREAFSWDLKTWICFGGYPGLAGLARDPVRFKRALRESIVEPVLNRDILSHVSIEKPALLRALFVAACQHAAEVVSYNRFLGQLTDKGNVTILSHYKELLEDTWLIQGLPKWSGSPLQRRASSPKWLPLAPALVTGTSDLPIGEWMSRPEAWGRLVEAAVGCHLAALCRDRDWSLYYWRDGNAEVDYVIKSEGGLAAVEVKSGSLHKRPRGLDAFLKRWPKARAWVVAQEGGMKLEEFLSLEGVMLFL